MKRILSIGIVGIVAVLLLTGVALAEQNFTYRFEYNMEPITAGSMTEGVFYPHLYIDNYGDETVDTYRAAILVSYKEPNARDAAMNLMRSAVILDVYGHSSIEVELPGVNDLVGSGVRFGGYSPLKNGKVYIVKVRVEPLPGPNAYDGQINAISIERRILFKVPGANVPMRSVAVTREGKR